jgi:hypothetical protein
VKKSGYAIAAAAVLLLIGIGLWAWLRPGAPPVPAPAPIASAPEAMPPPAPEPASAPPPIQYPVETTEAPASAPAAGPPPTVESTLLALLGRRTLITLFQLDNFVYRVVATVDNLGREKASPRLWPLNPASGHFTVTRQGDQDVIAAANASRYAPYVALLDRAEPNRVVALYKTFYPEFQRAYEDLGYSGRYFNDRLVEVIDQLLHTPEPGGAVAMHLPVINGPVQPERPWVLYEFNDPALQSLSAGQRILLRMAPDQRRRTKAWLGDVRALVARRR